METKSWLQSKGIWGAVIAGLPILGRVFGFELGPDWAEGLVNDITSLIGVVLAIYGRVKAVKKIG